MRTAPHGAIDEADRVLGSHEAAFRIVEIQDRLVNTSTLNAETRERLATEQRTIWESLFPETPFEAILALAY